MYVLEVTGSCFCLCWVPHVEPLKGSQDRETNAKVYLLEIQGGLVSSG